MKPHIQATQDEKKLAEEDFIVSKTDISGRITYANRIFMHIAGYSERDLLGIQHNIIRHPDMPRGVFRFMWNTLKAGDEFFGFAKNLCADGVLLGVCQHHTRLRQGWTITRLLFRSKKPTPFST
jgi:PAS domain S-box-containing protein